MRSAQNVLIENHGRKRPIATPRRRSKYIYIFLMEASRRAYKRNITLNSVRQHNYFITQGNYIGYMFRL